jgi:hypothetical protein
VVGIDEPRAVAAGAIVAHYIDDILKTIFQRLRADPSSTPTGISEPDTAPIPAPIATPIGPAGTPRPPPISAVAVTRSLASLLQADTTVIVTKKMCRLAIMILIPRQRHAHLHCEPENFQARSCPEIEVNA